MDALCSTDTGFDSIITWEKSLNPCHKIHCARPYGLQTTSHMWAWKTEKE